MKLDVFCAWGDGPDVGINITRTDEEVKGWVNANLFIPLDFTASEARELAAKLVAAAEQAEFHDRECARYERGIKCTKCNGSGGKVYGDTTCGRGGAGGQMITTVPCKECEGTGYL